MPLETLESLTAEYGTWLDANGFPVMSADELLAELEAEPENSTWAQRAWLSKFLDRWEVATDAERNTLNGLWGRTKRHEWWKQFPAGTRVRFVRHFGEYPIDPVRPGETGTVAELVGGDPEKTDTWLAVKLDKHHPDLGEWDNEVHVYVYAERHRGEEADECPIEVMQ